MALAIHIALPPLFILESLVPSKASWETETSDKPCLLNAPSDFQPRNLTLAYLQASEGKTLELKCYSDHFIGIRGPDQSREENADWAWWDVAMRVASGTGPQLRY